MPKKVQQRARPGTPKTVTVNSRTYGKHTRAARGSKSAAALNDAYHAYASKTRFVNNGASSVYNMLRLYCFDFKEGQLWQHMLSRMRKANSADFLQLLLSLRGLELNSRYTFERFGVMPAITVKPVKNTMQVILAPIQPPHFKTRDDGYQYEMIALLFDNKGNSIAHEKQASVWMPMLKDTGINTFVFAKPAKAKYYLICLHLQGGMKGKVSSPFPSHGMMVADAGSLVTQRKNT